MESALEADEMDSHLPTNNDLRRSVVDEKELSIILKHLAETDARMEEGFRRVHSRLDGIKEGCAARQLACKTEFSEIRTCIQVEDAVDKAVKVEIKKREDAIQAEILKRDAVLPTIKRAAIVVVTGGALALIFRIAIFHIPG